MKPAAGGIHIREDVWELTEWDPTLLWYARAVKGMSARPITDPTSWRYQAAIHDYIRTRDPLAVNGETMPSSADQTKYWRQCQHGSWFFLPWHRGYLAYFEQIVRAEIVRQGGPADWALPYWNYSDDEEPNARLVRKEFLTPTLPDASPNALADASREGPISMVGGAGDFGIDDFDVALDCLEQPTFEAGVGSASFGGPATGFHHNSGPAGDLEAVPHGSVHVGVGGWLGAFNTAGLDPLFWLHHANIDRLWQVWLNRNPAFENPSDAAWLTAVAFAIHDASGQPITFTSQDVLDTRAPSLAYAYEDTSDPLATAGLAAAGGPVTMAGQKPPPTVLAGASHSSVALASDVTTAHVTVDPTVLPTAGAALAGAGPGAGRVYLNLENITGTDNTSSYRVYVNAPEGVSLPKENYAGLLPMFGVEEASNSAALHGGSGLTYVLDITRLVERMKNTRTWRDGELKVTFVQKRKGNKVPDLKVGRISLYYS